MTKHYVTFTLRDNSICKAFVSLDTDGFFSSIAYLSKFYHDEPSFKAEYDYVSFISSKKEVINALSLAGFQVRDMERNRYPFSIRMAADHLRMIDKHIGEHSIVAGSLSRSDIINQAILGACKEGAMPPRSYFKGDTVCTCVNLLPEAYILLQEVSNVQGTTMNQILYDSVIAFFDKQINAQHGNGE